jgi:hypothetical protein
LRRNLRDPLLLVTIGSALLSYFGLGCRFSPDPHVSHPCAEGRVGDLRGGSARCSAVGTLGFRDKRVPAFKPVPFGQGSMVPNVLAALVSFALLIGSLARVSAMLVCGLWVVVWIYGTLFVARTMGDCL